MKTAKFKQSIEEMQLLNHKVIFPQLDKLVSHVAEQINLSTDPWLKEIPFDSALFSGSHRKLSSYLLECRLTLSQIKRDPPNNAQLRWQVERLVEQCQALLKTLASLPKKSVGKPYSRTEELQGYEQRLIDMEAALQLRLHHTEGFAEQQRLLLELEKTQQRLARCQLAQTEHHWKGIFTFQPNRDQQA